MSGPSIVEMTEQQVWALAESELADGGDWPVLMKWEWEPTESAVCLKQTKKAFILAASCDREDAIRFFISCDGEAMRELAARFADEMEASGNPLSGAVTF
jgi:hypothetical protein